MSGDWGKPPQKDEKSGGTIVSGRSGEPTQRFSALQQQLLCAAVHFFHRHIRSDADVLQRMEGNQMFRLFFEVQYHNNKPDLNPIFPESVHDSSALHVCSFILSILHQGIFSVSAFIVSVIYLSRFKECSHITLHACTWRPLFLTALLLADKMWEDKPVRNSSLAKLFPVLSNLELNKMESEFLSEIRFNVLIKPDLFCSFCEKLLAEQVHQEIQRCVHSSQYAETLEADNAAVNASQPGKAPHVSDMALDAGKHWAAQEAQKVKTVVSEPRPEVQTSLLSARADPLAAVQNRGGLWAVADGQANGNGAATQQPKQQQGGLLKPEKLGQVSSGWLDSNAAPGSAGRAANPSDPAAVAGAAGPAGAVVSRSQSAGPTTAGGARRVETAASRAAAEGNRLSLRSGAGGISQSGASKSAMPTSQLQPPRSVSVHPLHRTESQKKTAGGTGASLPGKAEERQEEPAPGRPRGPPGSCPVPGAGMSQSSGRAAPGPPAGYQGPMPLRRSLPAKTAYGQSDGMQRYAPLARAQSSGSSGGRGDGGQREGAAGATTSSGACYPACSASGSTGACSCGASGSGATLLGAGQAGAISASTAGLRANSSSNSTPGQGGQNGVGTSGGVSGSSSHPGREEQSSPRSGRGLLARQPRSPGSVSPVLVPQPGHCGQAVQPQVHPPCGQQASSYGGARGLAPPLHRQQDPSAGRSNSQNRGQATAARFGGATPAQPSSYGGGCGGSQAQRVATPPVPMPAHGGLCPAQHLGPAKHHPTATSRGASPGDAPGYGHSGAGHGHTSSALLGRGGGSKPSACGAGGNPYGAVGPCSAALSGGHPARASSAPRVAGLGHLATPPGPAGPSSVRNQTIQAQYHSHAMPSGPPHGHHNMPSSPSLNSPMVFPASPILRGTSPSPPGVPMACAGGGISVNAGRGLGIAGAAPRNASPNGCLGGVAGPAVAQMTGTLSTRGRSPPHAASAPGPGGGSAPSTARQPRAREGTPGALLKGALQGGLVQRSSFGNPMVNYRG